jgi:diguanylate cyclase (GGDEF)-like protein
VSTTADPPLFAPHRRDADVKVMTPANPPTAQCSRLLLVDDDPEMHHLVKVLLRSSDLTVVPVSDGDQALEMARRDRFDLILLDYDLPGANGLEVFNRLRAASVAASTPVVFITGQENLSILTACFRAGASDYVRKPFCAEELRARVRSLLDRRQMLVQLERLALHDTLTELPNRAAIRSRIQAAIDRGQGEHVAVLFLDVDRFKLVNDSLGHDVGDELLRQIAARLCKALRRGDGVYRNSDAPTAARLGGDEFVVLLESLTDAKDATKVADRLLTSLAEPYHLGGQEVCSAASIGVVANVQSYARSDDVLRDADTAMYAAKSAGKGRYALFNDAMRADVERRLRIETQLRSAIANDELFLVYQPIVSLATGHTTGFEALVRWQHPQRDLIQPMEFLPIAEESGLIVPLGAWALDRACREFAGWQRSLGDAAPSNIQVNLSRKQLLVGDLVSHVEQTLNKHGIQPACLHLEITESEIMQDLALARATLGALREGGVKIDMDDFGTGHSSLACLQELPIDVLKIDRSFITNMERSRSFAAVVHAVNTLGQNLGMTIIAEGIETADQVAMLQGLDCEYGQGFFFGKPMASPYVKDHMCRADEHDADPARGTSGPTDTSQRGP